MDNLSRDDVNGMADLIRAMGDAAFLDDGEPAAPSMPNNAPGYFKAGDIDPVTGLAIENIAGEITDADVPAYMAESMAVGNAPRVPVHSEDNQAMANILRAFHQSGGDNIFSEVEKTSEILFEESEHNPELRRAMKTERTTTGVRIGGWEIVTEQVGKSPRYHVVSSESGQVIAKNLYLYEAAEAMVEFMNEGMMVNNMKLQNILLLEMDYSKHLEDAIQHKHSCSRAIDRGDDARLEVSKIRFNESKTKAVAAKKKLVEHLSSK